MPTPHALEHRALLFLDALTAGRIVPDEDPNTAFFSTWPSASRKTACLLAGYANAARGRDVLWLITTRRQSSNKRPLPPTAQARLDLWLNALTPYFDGLVPVIRAFEMSSPTQVAKTNARIVGLQIESGRAPFVVRVGGNGSTLEIPWWDAVSGQVRSANRQDLIRLLVPMQDLPQFDVLDADLSFYKNLHVASAPKIAHRWTFDGSLYVVPQPGGQTVIPLHRCRAGLSIPGTEFSSSAQDVTFTVDKQSPAVRVTESALLIEGPGRVFVFCSGSTATAELSWRSPLKVTFDLLPARMERAAVVSAQLNPELVTENNQSGRWKL